MYDNEYILEQYDVYEYLLYKISNKLKNKKENGENFKVKNFDTPLLVECENNLI